MGELLGVNHQLLCEKLYHKTIKPQWLHSSCFCCRHKIESSGHWFNIKISSYQYRKSHCGDEMILRPPYLHNGIFYTGKMTPLYCIRAPIRIASWNMMLHVSHHKLLLLTEIRWVSSKFISPEANMGPIWGRQDPGGPHVVHMNFAVWDMNKPISSLYTSIFIT